MSDRVAVMRDGRLVQIGTPRELYDQPRTRFVADFLGCRNFLSATVDAQIDCGFVYNAGGQRLVQARDGQDRSPGQAVCIAVRPEKIKLSLEKPPDSVNAVAASVDDISFVGSNFQVQLRTALGPIGLTVPVWGCPLQPVPGLAVWASWEPNASSVVIDD